MQSPLPLWPEGPGLLLGAEVGVTRVTGYRKAVTVVVFRCGESLPAKGRGVL